MVVLAALLWHACGALALKSHDEAPWYEPQIVCDVGYVNNY